MKNEKKAIAKLTNINSKVSSHYLIKTNGEILTLVTDLYIYWQAGASSWKNYKSIPQFLKLPTAPESPIKYLYEDNRPQPSLDVFNDKGMAVSIGRLKNDKIFDVKFFSMSHNTIRGAAGGAILVAELLYKQNFLKNS